MFYDFSWVGCVGSLCFFVGVIMEREDIGREKRWKGKQILPSTGRKKTKKQINKRLILYNRNKKKNIQIIEEYVNYTCITKLLNSFVLYMYYLIIFLN